ncbi:MAG: hypothetical protein AABZ47_10990 [Planctomycetota bacterium]
MTDPKSNAKLGEAEISARSGQTFGQNLLIGVAAGPENMSPHMDDDMAKILLYNSMAQSIVKALERAKSGM